MPQFTIEELFEAFSHYAFCSTSDQPYTEDELKEQFQQWILERFSIGTNAIEPS